MALTNPMDVNVVSGGSTTTGITGKVADPFIPEMWSKPLLDTFDKKSVMLGLFNDHSDALSGGGDVVHLPTIGNVTVTDAPSHGSAMTFDGAGDTGATTDITVNQHEVAHLLLPDIVKIQASYDLVKMYANRIGTALAEAIDNYIMGTLLLGSGAFSSTSGVPAALGVDMADSMDGKIDEIAEKCVQESGSTDGWNIVIGPKLYGTLSTLSSGAGLVYGTPDSPFGSSFNKTGQVGKVMGMNILTSNNAYLDNTTLSANAGKNIAVWNGFDSDDGTADTAFRGLLVHDDALHVAFKKKAVMNVTYEHLYLSHLMSSEVVFGMARNHDNAAGKRRIFVLHS